MWGLISAIIATIIGFGAGSAGIGKTATNNTIPLATTVNAACYNPQPNVRLTLKWPDNFVNVKDKRTALNGAIFANSPATFQSDPICQNLVMSNKQTRNYILVRENVRISSCKTDELSGPLGKGTCPDASFAGGRSNRGSCDINGYTDIRKIADANLTNGKTVEVYWNPFSYNVGCNYKQDENCGPGERRNLNLKDFIYVLKSRDAFIDPDDPGKRPDNEGCPVQWDAGSANYDACSHHFDVYMAEDLYIGSRSAPATNDPESPYYFIKQVLENCQEKTQFIPAPEADLSMPPLYLKSPFIWQNDKNIYNNNKIIPATGAETVNYTSFVWTFPDVFYNTKTASTVNLIRVAADEKSGPFDFCSGAAVRTQANTPTGIPTPAPNKNVTICYDSLGSIFLKDDKGKNVKFQVYSKAINPQTFTLINSSDLSKGYVYTITDKEYPSNEINNKSLQLRAMQIIMKNAWTWATPWCKPAIYMYPEKTTAINVKLSLDGSLTVSNPVYDTQNGWSVVAEPSGKIVTPLTLSDYPYLYYEAELKGVDLPKEGWVIERSKIKDQVSKVMKDIGFNQKETDDFMHYWLPRLADKPYYFVSLLPEDVINQKEKLSFSVSPDTLIRSRFVFEGLDAPISVKPLTNIPNHTRDGFTVTDWGGTLVNHSCTDITVK